ncbi:phosphatidylglycerol phosphatidylinositol transfer [Fusarium heterosporum]|uniref:Phosphatidylglycerol/phosphatidylinositol transfer protein n=1 Tax=Fusarium heterosporum TaxID=42747 RepID=A0A8H5TBA4_FUSHE|nr:phosphatidylglycerol phosphatidylinositol transfer [Fusarium heterosporum]
MRFSTVTACLTACLAPVAAFSVVIEKTPDVAISDNLKIPGDSPLELCPGDHSADLIKIDSVDLSPNPPKAGQELLIKAKGTVKQKIEEGAYVLLTVKYGLIRLISTKADLCEQIGNVDLKCPVEAGVVEVTKSVDLPNEIPSGKYTVLADVFTVDDVQMTCLTATVVFSRSSKSFFGSDL